MATDLGGNKYTGVVRSDNGTPLEGVEVKIRYTNSSGQSILKTAKTGKDGVWSSSIDNGVDLSTVTITYVKSNFTSFTIKNPKISDTFQFPPPTIDPFRGGTFNLQGSYDSGKYLVSSLSSYDQGLLDYNLAGALQFVRNYQDTGKAALVIKASESQIGNYDREPSASDGTANKSFGASLAKKQLSEYRANNLETYIKQYFKDNGQPAPNIQKSLEVNGPIPPSPFPARDTPEYKKVLEKFKEFQYVNISALFTGPPCIDIPFTGSQMGSVTLIKPTGATKITINALLYPDRFGFSSTDSAGLVYTNTYYQAPNSIGNPISWGFIIHLREISNPSRLPPASRYTLLIDGDAPRGNLRQSLIDDWFLQEDGTKTNRPGPIAYQIIQHNRNISNNKVPYRSEEAEKHIDYCFNSGITVDRTANKVYGYEITRGELVYDLRGINDNNPFIIGFVSGNVSGGGTSLWTYRMCPN